MSVVDGPPDDMRQRAEWMSKRDDQILELIRDYGAMTPVAMSEEGMVERIPVGRSYIGDRCAELTEFGLLYKIDTGLYALTDKGEAYLNEELDASELDLVED